MILLSIAKQFDGIIDITVATDKKSYTYNIGSEYIARKIEKLCRKRRNKEAWAMLNKWNI